MDCIMTQGAGARSRGATIRPEGPVTRPHDTASRATTRSASTQGQAALSRAWFGQGLVTIQKLYRGWGRPFMSQYGVVGMRYSTVTWQQCVVT